MSRKRQLLADTIRAETSGEDLQESLDTGRIQVCAQLSDGTLYEIGSVSVSLACQSPKGAHLAIERIKYGRRG